MCKSELDRVQYDNKLNERVNLIDFGPVMGQKQTRPSLAEVVKKSSLGEK